jgi:Sec-independent protein secretion pathway component TatC
MLLLAIPMVLLYELGIVMIGRSQPTASYDA